jgi:hypothetical protein
MSYKHWPKSLDAESHERLHMKGDEVMTAPAHA